MNVLEEPAGAGLTWGGHAVVLAAAAIWFVIVVPLAAWFETRRHRQESWESGGRALRNNSEEE